MIIEMNFRPKELIGYVYKYTNKINGKVYIGKTANLRRRLWEHENTTKTKDTAFGRALKKYGYNNFELDILIKIKRIKDKQKLNTILDNLERYYIKKYNSYHFGYNLTRGGDGSIGITQSAETRRKKSVSMKNKPEEYKEKLRQRLAKVSHKFKSGDAMKYRHREIEQYTLDGTYIQTFYSVKDAAQSLSKTMANGIISACQGKYKTAYGYKWKYKINKSQLIKC